MDEAKKLNALEKGESSQGKVFEQAAAPSLYEQASRAPRRVKVIALLAGALFLYLLSGGTILGTGVKHTKYTYIKPRYLGYGGRWPGYHRLKHHVFFGDSYTETGFQADGPLPSVEDPLGNPADHAAWTSANGPNWAVYLPTVYNASFVKAINFAHGGATVDHSIIPQYHPAVRSLNNQILHTFIPKFGGFSPPKNFSWLPEDTLFTIWHGINDVHNSFTWDNKSQIQYNTLSQYAILVDKLYQSGARNFLILTIPPTDISPITAHEGPVIQKLERLDIQVWNDNILKTAKELHARYTDVTVFVFDTHDLFTEMINNPCNFPETCHLKDTREWCPPFKKVAQGMHTEVEGCPYPLDHYFWKDALHPTYPPHQVIAKQVAKFLNAVPRM